MATAIKSPPPRDRSICYAASNWRRITDCRRSRPIRHHHRRHPAHRHQRLHLRLADRLRHCRRLAYGLPAGSLQAAPAAGQSAVGFPADVRPAGLACPGERPDGGPGYASHAIRLDRPSQGRGASENRTGTNPDRAIRCSTSSSVCHGIRTELGRRQRLHRPPCAGRPARSRQHARGRRSSLQRVRAPGPQSTIRSVLSWGSPRLGCRGRYNRVTPMVVVSSNCPSLRTTTVG